MCMDIEPIIGLVVLAFFGLDIFTGIHVYKENKAKTGRFFPSWGSMSTLRKANTVGLLILVIVMFYWLYNYSILAPWLWVNDVHTIFRSLCIEGTLGGRGQVPVLRRLPRPEGVPHRSQNLLSHNIDNAREPIMSEQEWPCNQPNPKCRPGYYV